MVSANKRKEKDVMKLLVSDYEVIMASELNNNEFFVKFNGPKESPYEGVGTCTQIWVNSNEIYRVCGAWE